METSDNIIAGFKKCGIYPLNPEEVLKCLPDAEIAATSNADIGADVSDAVLEFCRNEKKKANNVQSNPSLRYCCKSDHSVALF